MRSDPVSDEKYVLKWGKYKGCSIAEVLEFDAQYIEWLHHNTEFEVHYAILDKAENGGKEPTNGENYE